MFVYRYMRLEELNKIMAGIEICSHKKFKKYNTTSEGICFLPSVVKFYSESIRDSVEFSPTSCFSFLQGIISSDSILVEFETFEKLNTSTGCYADPFTDDCDAVICIDELCINSYSRETFIPKRYSFAGEDAWYNLS